MRKASTRPVLPSELILEIFLRLPTKSLKRLSCVFDDHPVLATALKSPSFRHKHAINVMSQHANQQLLIPSSVEGHAIHVIEPLESLLQVQINHSHDFEQLFKHFLPFEENSKGFKVIGECDGLVCLFFEFFRFPEPHEVKKTGGCACCSTYAQRKSSYHFVLWNPFTGEHHALPTPQDVKFNLVGYGDVPPTACGFGYDVVDETYKVVLGDGSLTVFYHLSSNEWKKGKKVQVDSWTKFDYLRYGTSSNSMANFGHYLNGSLYWIVSGTTIVSIDLSTEVSTRLKLPHCCSSDDYNRHKLSIGVMKGCLSVSCFRNKDKEVGIWVYGGRDELWTNMFTVRLPADLYCITNVTPPLWLSKDEEVVLFLFGNDILCWNRKAEDFTFADENLDLDYIDRVIVHVDTLVSPRPKRNKDNNEAIRSN